MGSGLSGRLGNQRVVTSGTFGAWSPANVPEVAAGYFWLAASGTGLGTAGFKVPEGNGHTTFDLVQATVAKQPTQLTEAGGVQYRMRNAADANPSIIATAGAVQAGWTGSTYVAGWFRLPNASGDISGAGNLFVHTPTAAGQRRFVLSVLLNSGDRVSVSASSDGTATVLNQWGNIYQDGVGGSWVWTEALDTAGTSVELYANGALVSHTTTAVPNATLFDGNAPIAVGCRAAASLANVDTTDWATCYYCNGIPSLANREALFRHNAPA